jgi:hypothetical protein
MTAEASNPSEPSVVFVVDTVTGFPEISYFKTALFNATINPVN